jgi:hypothetical protein
MEPAQACAIGGVENEIEGHSPRGEPPLDLGGEALEPLPALRRDQHRTPSFRLTFGVVVQANSRITIQPVDLVPNLQQAFLAPPCDAQLRQDVFDVERLGFGILV